MTKKQREAVYNKYNGHCAYCGKAIEYKDMQVDHIIPQRRATAKAGKNRLPKEAIENEENYICSCRSCNHYKRAHSLETFRRYIEEIPEKLTRDNYIYKVGLRYGLIEEHPRKIKFYFEEVEENKMNNWVKYRNGNYDVLINLDNGTKIRKNDIDYFDPEYPESADIKITNKCSHMCKCCHENSTPDGKHADILNAKFIDTLHPYMELAIGGGNPLEHPDLEAFLYKCKDLKLIPSMTVHQGDFMDNLELFRRYRDEKLLYGIGVSISYVTNELIEALKEFPNAVCHIIAGIASEAVINKLAHNDLKILILGYKLFRRGEELYNKNSTEIDFLIQYMYDLLPTMIDEEWFNTISFDNLAIEQLKPNRLMSEEQYNEFYMGDDGSHTLFIDLVEEQFAVSSTRVERYPLMDNIVDMFDKIKEVSKKA